MKIIKKICSIFLKILLFPLKFFKRFFLAFFNIKEKKLNQVTFDAAEDYLKRFSRLELDFNGEYVIADNLRLNFASKKAKKEKKEKKENAND